MAIIADAEIRFRSVGDDRTLSSLRRVSSQVRTTSRDSMNAVRGVNSFSTSLRSLGRIAAGGLSLAGVIGGFRGLITAAAEAEDSGDRIRTVFGSVGNEAVALSETLGNSINVSTRETQNFLSIIGSIAQAAGASQEASLGLAEEIVNLGGNLASFNSLNPAEGINALRNAVLIGEAESLRSRTGIDLSATALRNYAEETGRTYTELSRLEMIQLRLELAFRDSGDAVDDLERTQFSFNNQLNRARAELSDLSASLGEGLLPAATSALRLFNRLVDALGQVRPSLLATVGSIGGVTAALTLLTGSPIVAGIGLIVTAFGALTESANAAQKAADNFGQESIRDVTGDRDFVAERKDLVGIQIAVKNANEIIDDLRDGLFVAANEYRSFRDLFEEATEEDTRTFGERLRDLITAPIGDYDAYGSAQTIALDRQEMLITRIRQSIKDLGLEGVQLDAAYQAILRQASGDEQLLALLEEGLGRRLIVTEELEKQADATEEIAEMEAEVSEETDKQLTIFERQAVQRQRQLRFQELTSELDNSRIAQLERQEARVELLTRQQGELLSAIESASSPEVVEDLFAEYVRLGGEIDATNASIAGNRALIMAEANALMNTTIATIEVVDRLGEALERASSAGNFQEAIASIIELSSQLESAGDRTGEVIAEIERLATSSISTGLQVTDSVVGSIQMISSAELQRQQAVEDIQSARDDAEIQRQRDILDRFDEETAAQRANIETQVQNANDRAVALEMLDMARASARMNIEQQATSEIDRINRERAQRQYEIELQQFNAQKGFSIANAAIGAAQAVIQGFAQLGPIGGAIAAGVTAALTGVQIGIIASTPPPPPPALQEGGIIRATPGGTTAVIGEGGSDEAVLPLNEQAYTRLGRAIADNIPTSSSNPNINVSVFLDSAQVATAVRIVQDNEITNTRTLLNNNNNNGG